MATLKYVVYFWLFFGSEDKSASDPFYTKEEADKECERLNALNGDYTYSGYYTKQI